MSGDGTTTAAELPADAPTLYRAMLVTVAGAALTVLTMVVPMPGINHEAFGVWLDASPALPTLGALGMAGLSPIVSAYLLVELASLFTTTTRRWRTDPEGRRTAWASAAGWSRC